MCIATFSIGHSAPVQAYTLGAADSATADPAASAALHAGAYRVVIDPTLPLSTYDARIAEHMALGQAPQLVIGGTGTITHNTPRGVVEAAVAAAKRWPYAYSFSVVNEPNESGISVCQYVHVYLQAYRALRALGARRILYGEWSPNNTLGWQHATLTKCGRESRALRGKIGRVAWHGYSAAIDFGRALRSMTHRIAGQDPRLYVTEAGYPLSFYGYAGGDMGGVRYWRHALQVARTQLSEIVVWEIHAPAKSSVWDSSIVDATGRPRPAFHLIAARN